MMEDTRLSYVYRISFEDGSWYWGSRKCPAGILPQDDTYTGSPVTHKAKWKTDPFTKEIVEVFSEHTEAADFEYSLIIEDIGKGLCLNKNAGGVISPDMCSVGGMKSAEKTRGKKRSSEIGRKISAAKVGKKLSEAHKQALRDCSRRPVSAETIASRIGKKWWNNGVKATRSFECPGEGWVLGKKLKRES